MVFLFINFVVFLFIKVVSYDICSMYITIMTRHFIKKRLFNTINLARWTDLLFTRSKAKKKQKCKKNKKGENLVRKTDDIKNVLLEQKLNNFRIAVLMDDAMLGWNRIR